MTSIAANLQAVRARIAAACAGAGRATESVQLLAVSKTWPAASVREAIAAGQRAFGENYVQEAVAKAAELGDPGLEWHFIGPLQGNKTRLVAENFAWVHSVERLKIAERLAAQRPAGLPALQVCLQVNISGEASKSGCSPDELPDLARAFVAVAEQGGAGFRTLHFGGHTLTGTELLAALEHAAAELGIAPARGFRHGGMPWGFIRAVGFVHPMWRELARMSYLWRVPHALDGRRLAALYGVRSTPLPQALRSALIELGLAGANRAIVAA